MSSPQCGENEDHSDPVIPDPSPDVSLSSGPIDPLGAEKDSGSEPETSHNDLSPAHSYALRSQHEWLRCHLRAATSEKSKLEELTARLTEKTERLQYELADAKEAAKSRDEVIQLLQGQLARMEAAYTKSLEESVQSRLQLSSHEQEILHLKELCYRYQEEKEAAGNGAGELEQELQLRIKLLEEEREKMRGELSTLEEEKSLLEGRLRVERQGGAEVMEQCQRWKERCGRLEEMVEGYESRVRGKAGEVVEEEREGQERRLELERRMVEVSEENAELRGRVESLGAAVERERRRAVGAEEEKEELRAELRRQKAEVEGELRKLEKETEEKMVRKLKEKEEEVGGLVAQFEREREWLLGVRKEGEGWGELCRVRGGAGEGRWGRRRRRKGGRLGFGEEGPGGDDLGEGRAVWGGGEAEPNRTFRELDFLALKKQVLSLESKMSDEENLRRALENEMMKMRVNLGEKESLQVEVDSLRRRVGRHCAGKLEMELLEHERDLQARRERCLGKENLAGGRHDCGFKAKCEVLAKEREKAQQLSKSRQRRPSAQPTAFPPPHPDPSAPPTARSHPTVLLHPRQLALHPDIKSNLDYQLDKTIRKYLQDSASAPSAHDLHT